MAATTSYYARRSAVDPDWRAAQLGAAADRARRRRELDPDAVRTASRDSARRIRHRHAQTGLTFYDSGGASAATVRHSRASSPTSSAPAASSTGQRRGVTC